MVPPVGVADSGTATIVCAGSFVKIDRVPLMGVPAGAGAGMEALTLRTPDFPLGMLSDVGVTRNAEPTMVDVTANVAVPGFVMVSALVTSVAPQLCAPKAIVLALREATGVPLEGGAATSAALASPGIAPGDPPSPC